jgi:hypothetical protein
MKQLLSPFLFGSYLLLPAGFAQAQTSFRIGPQVGASLATGHTAGVGNPAYHLGCVAGVQASLSWPRFALEPAVLFCQKGNTLSQDVAYRDPVTGLPNQHGTFTSQLRLNYLTLPLHLTFAPAGPASGPQFFAGPYLGLLLGGTHSQAGPDQVTTTSPVYVGSPPTVFNGYYAQRYDAGVQAGLGYRFQHLVLQAEYSLGLREVAPGSAFAASAVKPPATYNRAFQASVSYLVACPH